jgi:hypothetical protein
MSEWRDIEGYEGVYQVSDQGQVRSLDRLVRHWRGGMLKQRGKVLKPIVQRDKRGRVARVQVNLSCDGCAKTTSVHRIVLETFLGPCPDGMEGCHGDGDPTNNAISNLRWDTGSSNMQDCIRHGRLSGGRLERPVVRSDGVEFESISQAAEVLGVHCAAIVNACRGRSKTSVGYGWKYKSQGVPTSKKTAEGRCQNT